MTRKHHYLKTETRFYQAVEHGIKRFDLRKNDRDYQIGDIIHLQETVNTIYTGRTIFQLEIRYILFSEDIPGLEKDYCILQF